MDPILEIEARASAGLDAPYVERFTYEALEECLVDVPAVYDRNSWSTKRLKKGDTVELPGKVGGKYPQLKRVEEDEWEPGIERLREGVFAALICGMSEQRIRVEVEAAMAEIHEDTDNEGNDV